MSLILANILGFISLHKRLVIGGLAGILLLILMVVYFKSCGRRELKIDQNAIEKINSANERERRAELQRVIEDNAETIQTVDNRSKISETNVIERNRLIDDRVKAADVKIQEARNQKGDVTAEELEQILLGDK